jgi:DNA-binding XRE family transcriptional regulator
MGIAINRIKVVLAERNKTNKWLAEALGKNEATVSRWCTNENQPSVETCYQIAKILDIDIRELFNRTR